ncbi:hypothetical protein NJB1907Z4_C44310 [Mycobacterium pseudoshottsii]|uniref:Alpha/beta hydrolase n=2 Tax=Mycobacterium pseudoshottsii TaxID=265949 RepID=A0A9N7LUC3_9MYCO|nr:hypothetical protein NJB1907Z4_C44310 [Mycobacterium pseudoshottsii]
MARTAIANKAISEYLRPRGSLGSGTEANTSRNSDPMNSLRSPGLQRSNTSGTDDTGNTETVGTGNSRPTTNSNQLDRSPDSPCLHSGPNSAAPKIINPAHKPANQQRRSPGSEGVQDFLDKVPHAEFVELSNAGHTAAGDDNDAFTEVVVDFVKRRAATG